MPKEATGEVTWKGDRAYARITVRGRRRVQLQMPHATTEDEANARALLLADVARRLRAVGVDEAKARKALELVAAASPRSLQNALDVAVGELAGGKLVLRGAPKAPTFKEIGDHWVSGKLAQRYPDQIKVKRSAKDDKSRLAKHVYPVLQDVPIDRITLDHCEEVMRRLPADLEVATRRNIGQLVNRILAMAVYPLRLIATNPVPRGFLPGAPKRKAFGYLYPDEDSRLMACTAIPVVYRLLWGFLDREGMRAGEARRLTWSDLDLARGAVKLDQNKTDDPRAWALDAGVVAALKAYRTAYRPDAKPGEHVFLNAFGLPFKAHGLAEMLRAHLMLIGLDKERPELFTTTAQRRQMRVHDLRGTFVTVALANGRSEAWIVDRTGHRDSHMVAVYKRTARTFAELQTGELEPLDAAIPELRIAHGLPTLSRKLSKPLATPTGFEPVLPA